MGWVPPMVIEPFGGYGDDIFMWAPGDGCDFYDGGPVADVAAFGIFSELPDSDSNTSDAPLFNCKEHRSNQSR